MSDLVLCHRQLLQLYTAQLGVPADLSAHNQISRWLPPMKTSLMRPIMIMNCAAKTLQKCLPWFGHSSSPASDPISSQVSGSASIFCGSSFAPMAWFVSWATWRDRQAVPWPCASRLSAFTASPVVVGCWWLKNVQSCFIPFFKIGISIFRIWVWMRLSAFSQTCTVWKS